MTKKSDEKYIPHSIEDEYDMWENNEELIDKHIENTEDYDREIDDYD